MRKLRQSIAMALVQGNCQSQDLNIGWCKNFRSLHGEMATHVELDCIEKRNTMQFQGVN